MKFYQLTGSPYARRVDLVIEHLGIPVEKVLLDWEKNELKSDSYLAINPNGKVPTLVDGDLELWESTAIIHYLADKHKSSLYPQDTRARAEILRWICWDLTAFGRAVLTLTMENFFKPAFLKQEPDPATVEEATGEIHRFAPILNAQLEGKKYVLGDELTVADFALATSLMYKEQGKLPLEQYAEIRRWHTAIIELPAWKKTAQQP